jgi:hypothetical protein
MEWTCTRCGQTTAASDWATLTDAGWTLNSHGDCLCVVCLKPQGPTAAKVRYLPLADGMRLGQHQLMPAMQMRRAASGGPVPVNGRDAHDVYEAAPHGRRHLVLVR